MTRHRSILATALGHIAIRRASVAFHRADQLFRTLKAARLDGTLAAEVRRLTRVDLLIIDDFALQVMDPVATADFYELVVERHHKASAIVTSNREPAEWSPRRGRHPARPVRRRPPRQYQLRTHRGRRVLPTPATPRRPP